MDYQPKKKKNPYNRVLRRRWIILMAFVIISLGLGLIALIPVSIVSEEIFDATTIDVEGESAIPQIERALEAPLPESATNIHFYYTSWLDYYMQIRFDLPREDVAPFLNNINHMCLVYEPLQENLMPFGTVESKKQWWNPRGAEQFVGIAQCGDNPYWQMMIDQTDDNISIVYILSFST